MSYPPAKCVCGRNLLSHQPQQHADHRRLLYRFMATLLQEQYDHQYYSAQ